MGEELWGPSAWEDPNQGPRCIPLRFLGVKGAASAAFGDIRFLGGVEGVKEGESTLNFPRPKLLQNKDCIQLFEPGLTLAASEEEPTYCPHLCLAVSASEDRD